MSTTSTTGSLHISCYIRTLNEELLIARTVKAALAIAEEVVVVDSGSTDRTVERAQASGARIVRQEWLGLGGQKRVGEGACKHDWLLDIDADEVVSPELAAEIRELFRNGEPEHKVYGLTLVTVPPVGAPWRKFLLSNRNKLYDRRVIRMPDHKAWDQLQIPDGLSAGKLTGALYHFSFRDLAHNVEKQNRASTMMARDGKRKSPANLRVRIVFALPFYFMKYYAFRGLWRAGFYGFAVAVISAFGRWLRDVKLFEAYLLAKAADTDGKASI
jgi:glycosyltransferase involved in cell wall biosynthesis